MRIVNDKELLDYIDSLIEINAINMSVSDMLSEVIGNTSFTNKEKIEALKKRFNDNELSLIRSELFEYFELDDEDEEDVDIFDNVISPSIEESNINKYLSNPYYQRIKVKDIKEGPYSLKMDHYEEYELFPYLDMSYYPNSYLEKNSISFFNKRFDFLSINDKDVTWMCVTPNEIETMEKAVKEATNKVKVYGLGLGYYPYMISLKEDVKEIVIVENNHQIIELFKKHILPQFEHKAKIKIIEGDAFEELKKDDDYNYHFVDLWHTPLDGIELFLRSKKLEIKGKTYFYWLESSFYILLRRCFISFLEEQLSGLGDSDYQKSKNITDKIINSFYKQTKNLVLTSVSQLQDLLSDKSLLEMALFSI